MSVSGDSQGGISSSSHASMASSLGTANASQEYSGYSSYSSSTVPYAYTSSECQNYYYGYPQPTSVSSSQQVGPNQTTSGAAYQPLSSFQNSGSYVDPTSYLGTYCNAGDNQTTAGYGHNNYNYQNNLWNGGSFGNYPPHLYSSYTASDTNSTPSSTTVPTNSLYYPQQQYNQWSYYYSQSAPIASCAPGTDHSSSTGLPSGYSSEGVGGGYAYVSNQPPPPGTTSWRGSASSGFPASQEKVAVSAYQLNRSWEAGGPVTQNKHINQHTYFQMPLTSTPVPPEKPDNEQTVLYSQAPSLQHSSSNQVAESTHPIPVTDVRQVSKVQIPVNPRIAPNLGLGTLKTQKENSIPTATAKPAYLSVPVPKPSNKTSSQDDAQAIIKGTFPASLRAYVERTFARCKDDTQRSANQNIMKEIITKATADGSLFSKDWDTEPLFPLPNSISDEVEQSNLQNFVSGSSLPKSGRRTKSRWEPIADEKMGVNLLSINSDSAKDSAVGQVEMSQKQVDGKNYLSNINGWSGIKFVSPQQQATLPKFSQRPMKKPRVAYSSSVTENGDTSSDSDKEQSLTKYYASAIKLATSPEEKKRREHRFKRFEEGPVGPVQIDQLRPKTAGSGTYARRASVMLLARDYDDGSGSGVAVEDIDWDSLTVKGTCLEIEKRYLRLTSAPDPATVRPEEVLEKALKMVQSSTKNYFYKCDQLKSIRQDLTVQRIQNMLTVKVYETHARLALEAGDLPEYNQCQSQLKRLYAEGIEGCHMEFSAYNLLCLMLHSNNKRDLLSCMTRLSDEAKKNEAVRHALAVRSAVSSGNYIIFFKLYKAAPNLNACLMDLYLEKMRFEAVKCMSKSYRPTVPVVYIAQVLGFSKGVEKEDSHGAGTEGSEECEEWLRAHGAVLTIDKNGEQQLDAKASSSSLYMPEPEDAVAHGDANLAVDDFFTRAS